MRFTFFDINGYPSTFNFPLHADMIFSADTPCHTLDASFLLEATLAKAIPEMTMVEVWDDDNRLILDGFVDEQSFSLSQDGKVFRFLCRDYAALLIDNEALPQLYHNLSLYTLFERHIRKWGYSNLVTNNSPIVASMQIPKGSSDWDVLSSFCRKTLGTTPYVIGKTVYTSPRPSSANHHFSNSDANASHFISLKHVCNRFKVVSSVVMRDSYGYYSSYITNPDADKDRIYRNRYFIPSAQFQDSPRYDAQQFINNSNKDKDQVFLTISGIYNCSLGDNATVDIIPKFSRWRICDIHYSWHENNITTLLTLSQSL